MLKNKKESIRVLLILILFYIRLSSVHCNTFHDFNEEIQSITNELFSNLGLDSNFNLFENIQHLLTAHYKLRNISETNIEIYNIMKNVKDPIYKEIEDFLQIEQVLNELSSNYSFLTKETKFGHIRIDEIFENISSLVFSHNFEAKNLSFDITDVKKHVINSNEDVTESKEIILSSERMDFLEKIDKLTINDFLDKESDKSFQETRRFGKNQYYDLKKWSEKPKRRLFKAEATEINDYPFIVSVHVKEEFSCSGNIVSKTFILTSSSCLQSVYKNRLTAHNLPSVSVRIGSDFISKYGEMVPIVTIFFHPKYNPTYLKNNLAILRMEKHTYFRTNRNIRRIDFDDKKRKVLDTSHRITLLGWGSKYPVEKVNSNEPLAYIDLNIFNYEMCQKLYSSDYITGSNFCAGFIFKGGGACTKDDGGPAIINGVLVGIVSFAPTMCGAKNSPTVFTKISCYNNWIRSIINEDVSMKWNKTAEQETSLQSNISQNIHNKEHENNSYLGHKDSERYILRGLNNSIQKSNKKTPSQVSYKIELNVNTDDKRWNTMKYNKTKADSKNGYKTTVELPNNYNFYSVESDSTGEEGLSIEDYKENTLKQDKSTTKDYKLHPDRKTDVQKEKVIEEHFVNILENILKISTKKQFKDFLRQVSFNLKPTLTTTLNNYNKRTDTTFINRKKQEQSTKSMSSSTTLKPVNIYKKIIDFFTQK